MLFLLTYIEKKYIYADSNFILTQHFRPRKGVCERRHAMDPNFETYDSRIVPEDECIFWDQALNHKSDIAHYNWSRVPEEAKQLADHISSSYDQLWIESDWETGNDPVLFGKKNGKIYLLARWGTDEIPLRTEEQIMLSYRRKAEGEARRDYRNFQGLLFGFGILCILGGIAILSHNRLGYSGAGFLTVGGLLWISYYHHHKRDPLRPVNVWDQKAWEFVKHRQNGSV